MSGRVNVNHTLFQTSALSARARWRYLRWAASPLASIAFSICMVTGVAADTFASESETSQDPVGSSAPAIICDLETTADSIPDAPKLTSTTTDLAASVQPGEALASTQLVCTGVEDTIQVTETWSEGTTVLSSTTTQASNPMQTYTTQSYMTSGDWTLRTLTVCFSAAAAGFNPANACQTLSGL